MLQFLINRWSHDFRPCGIRKPWYSPPSFLLYNFVGCRGIISWNMVDDPIPVNPFRFDKNKTWRARTTLLLSTSQRLDRPPSTSITSRTRDRRGLKWLSLSRIYQILSDEKAVRDASDMTANNGHRKVLHLHTCTTLSRLGSMLSRWTRGWRLRSWPLTSTPSTSCWRMALGCQRRLRPGCQGCSMLTTRRKDCDVRGHSKRPISTRERPLCTASSKQMRRMSFFSSQRRSLRVASCF